MSLFRVILVCIFPRSYWIRTRITPNTGTFQENFRSAVSFTLSIQSWGPWRRVLYADFQPISWLAVSTNRIALECTVLMGSCKKKQTELEKLSCTFPTIYSLFMFVSFLVLTIHMLFSKEGKLYIIKSMKPAHIIVEWIFANFLG